MSVLALEWIIKNAKATVHRPKNAKAKIRRPNSNSTLTLIGNVLCFCMLSHGHGFILYPSNSLLPVVCSYTDFHSRYTHISQQQIYFTLEN